MTTRISKDEEAALKKQRREAIRATFFEAPLATNRYQAERVIGEGAYGVVVCARDTHTGERVAVKRISKCLNNTAFAVRILRELKFLRLLSRHENIIRTRDVLLPGQLDRFNDAFVVFELMPTDLEHVLRSKNLLRPDHVKYFMWQILRGVHFMHSSQVLHRDLKPNNILINGKCELRICDLGLARADFANLADTNLFWTDYVATRWYRAPELVIEGSQQYSAAIDIWSCGCIFAEMLNDGKVLFPGKNGQHQIDLITQVLGPLPANPVFNKLNPYAQRTLAKFQNAPVTPRRPLNTIFQNADPAAVDVLSKMLAFDPDQRISALDALNHPYFAEYRRLGLGQTAVPLQAQEFEFERLQLSTPQMRTEFLREILHYHPNVDLQTLQQLGWSRVVKQESAVDAFGKQVRNIRMGGQRLQSSTLQERVLDTLTEGDDKWTNKYAAQNRQNVTMGEAEMGTFNAHR